MRGGLWAPEARAEDTGGRGGVGERGERAAPEEWAEDQPARLDPGGGGLGPQPGGCCDSGDVQQILSLSSSSFFLCSYQIIVIRIWIVV